MTNNQSLRTTLSDAHVVRVAATPVRSASAELTTNGAASSPSLADDPHRSSNDRVATLQFKKTVTPNRYIANGFSGRNALLVRSGWLSALKRSAHDCSRLDFYTRGADRRPTHVGFDNPLNSPVVVFGGVQVAPFMSNVSVGIVPCILWELTGSELSGDVERGQVRSVENALKLIRECDEELAGELEVELAEGDIEVADVPKDGLVPHGDGKSVGVCKRTILGGDWIYLAPLLLEPGEEGASSIERCDHAIIGLASTLFHEGRHMKGSKHPQTYRETIAFQECLSKNFAELFGECDKAHRRKLRRALAFWRMNEQLNLDGASPEESEKATDEFERKWDGIAERDEEGE